ncbi:hypothetical protein D043_1132B, partial [Vibrio parahaemolyticus EKP-021]
TNC